MGLCVKKNIHHIWGGWVIRLCEGREGGGLHEGS